jgi:general secretion pathway protein M
MKAAYTAWSAQARAFWQQRSARERQGLLLASACIALALVWRIALAPALQTWQEAPAKQAWLDQQSQQMQTLQAQAQSLNPTHALTRREAVQWLEAHLEDLGPGAKLQLQADAASVSLQAAPAQALARWLSQARENAHVRPVQAQLQQVTSPPPSTPSVATAAPAVDSAVRWSGSLQLRLP